MNRRQLSLLADLLRASLGTAGFEKARDIMALNGEDLYFFAVMGTPSSTDPWGW